MIIKTIRGGGKASHTNTDDTQTLVREDCQSISHHLLRAHEAAQLTSLLRHPAST